MLEHIMLTVMSGEVTNYGDVGVSSVEVMEKVNVPGCVVLTNSKFWPAEKTGPAMIRV